MAGIRPRGRAALLRDLCNGSQKRHSLPEARSYPAVLWYLSILFFVFATNIEGGHLVGPSDLVSVLPFVAFIGLRHEARRTSDEQVLHIA